MPNKLTGSPIGPWSPFQPLLPCIKFLVLLNVTEVFFWAGIKPQLLFFKSLCIARAHRNLHNKSTNKFHIYPSPQNYSLWEERHSISLLLSETCLYISAKREIGTIVQKVQSTRHQYQSTVITLGHYCQLFRYI